MGHCVLVCEPALITDTLIYIISIVTTLIHSFLITREFSPILEYIFLLTVLNIDKGLVFNPKLTFYSKMCLVMISGFQ